MFSTNYQDILKQIDAIDPIAYGRTRNFIDGAVTMLSPYISRGVISTKQVFDTVLAKGFRPKQIEKFIQELAWRDYWQQIWIEKEDEINQDLRREQPHVYHYKMPKSIIDATTGIQAIDQAIEDYYETGYLHNHVRMYIASITCNVGGSHWRVPARWMYYHLLDGDWASNALSWQWVSGANAGKKYYANQQNINKYCYTHQKRTFMDVTYGEFEVMKIPEMLQETIIPDLKTPLPEKKEISIDPDKPTLIYNFYNLDPKWHEGENFNRVLLLEPSVFETYPVSQNSLNFMLKLSQNIIDLQVYIGEFDELTSEHLIQEVIYKEHPLNKYKGKEEPRDWMFDVTGYYRSFFAFWKKCQKELSPWNQPTLFG
ncbi:MAG: FAD-binding domain-containing protein [Bacteroidota bacterium]